MRTHTRWWHCLIGLGLMLAAGAGAPQVAPGTPLAGKRVLLLMSYGFGRVGLDNFTRSYLATMAAAGMSRENVAVEYLNLNRASPDYRRQMAALLQQQYGARPPELIVTVQQPALDYLLGELATLAPHAPIVSFNTDTPADRDIGAHRLLQPSENTSFRATLGQALRLFPDTRHLIVTVGSADADQAGKRQFELALAAARPAVTVEFTDRLTLPEMLQKVAQAPPRSIVISGPVNRDAAGTVLSQGDVAAQLAQAARAPFFVLFNISVGAGAVGGNVMHVERYAERMARASLAVLEGRLALALGVTTLAPINTSLYDWTRLKQWDADPARLPADTVFVNRPPALWDQHRAVVLATGGAFLVLGAMLGALLLSRQRLRQAQGQSRDSEERFRVLVEHAPEAIVVYDIDLARLVDANSKAERLFGCSRAHLLAGGPERFYLAEQPDGHPPEVTVPANTARSARGEHLTFERTVRSLDGRIFPCEVNLVQLPASGRRLLRGSLVDISERKRAEQELREHRHHLEQLVQQRTAALTVAVREAQSASHAKSVFLANMSHELRTPLNSVIGFSQMMHDAAEGEQQRNLAIINRSGHHLLTLINDILQFSKVEAGRDALQLAPVELAVLLGDALDMLGGGRAADAPPMRLDCAGPPPLVLADGAKLRQVLLNLLSNALKFAQSGPVTLALRVLPAGDDCQLQFAVRDTGMGIAAADLERIFEPFVQVDGPQTQAGTGLGLTIARAFVRLMGGELAVRSAPGAGAEFSFTIRARLLERAPAARAAPALAPGGGQGRRLLVVDDNGDCRKLVRDLLAPTGLQVLEAGEAARAMALLGEGGVELVLMDWRMPGMDGLALTRWIRAQPALTQPAVVMLTASAFDEQRREALAAGADDFLRKPIEFERLMALLEQRLGLRLASPYLTASGAVPVLSAEQLAHLPATVRGPLMQAVRELDLARAAALLGALGTEHGALVARIEAALAAHQYLPLWQMLHELEAGADAAARKRVPT